MYVCFVWKRSMYMCFFKMGCAAIYLIYVCVDDLCIGLKIKLLLCNLLCGFGSLSTVPMYCCINNYSYCYLLPVIHFIKLQLW